MKYAICNETYGDWGLERICEDVADAGYTGLEIAPFTLEGYGMDVLDRGDAVRLGDLVRSFGIWPIGLHWLLAKTTGYHLTAADDEINQRTASYLIEQVRFCAAMCRGNDASSGTGGGVMVFGSPLQRNIAEGQSYEDAFARAVKICREVCAVAADLDVTLVMEPLGQVETNFLTTASETIALIRAVDSPACRLHLDVKAMSSQKLKIEEIICQSQAYTHHFHANDPNLRGPGMGDIAFEPIFEALKQSHYKGYVSVEVFKYDPDAPTIARESLAYMKKIEGQMNGSRVKSF